jgi:hypothetical protein
MTAAADPLSVEISIFPGEQPLIWAMACWSGEIEKGLQALQPLRRFAKPVADTIEVTPWSGFLSHMPERPAPGGPNTYWRGNTLAAFSDTAIDQLKSALDTPPPGWQLGMGHFMHGRICRGKSSATPMLRKAGTSTQFISTSWTDARDAERSIQWVDETWAGLQRSSSSGTYANYLSDNSESAVRATYGAHYEQLARTKHRYDPTNLFHRNRNIRPSA